MMENTVPREVLPVACRERKCLVRVQGNSINGDVELLHYSPGEELDRLLISERILANPDEDIWSTTAWPWLRERHPA